MLAGPSLIRRVFLCKACAMQHNLCGNPMQRDVAGLAFNQGGERSDAIRCTEAQGWCGAAHDACSTMRERGRFQSHHTPLSTRTPTAWIGFATTRPSGGSAHAIQRVRCNTTSAKATAAITPKVAKPIW
jgi:hypothetical protein